MALIRSISLGLGVDTAGFTAPLKAADAQLGRFGRTAAAAQGQVNRLDLTPAGRGIKAFGLGLGSVAGTLAALGIARVGKDVVQTSIDMETALVKLAKATDLDAAGMATMKAQIFELGTTMRGVKLADLFEIATSGAKLGIAPADIVEYTRGIAMLSTAMDDIPADQIADSVGKINSVFKLGIRGALQLGSAIDKLADSGVSSASGILDVTQRVSGTASVMKLGAGETTALAAALLDTGTEAEAGASALNKLLGQMVRINQQPAFAKTIGISADEFAATLKAKPIDAIEAFLRALKGLNASSQLEVLDSVGVKGTRFAPNIQKLAQQVDTLHTYVGLAAHEFATLDQITKSYNATAQTTGAMLTQTGNLLTTFKDQIGQAALPTINDQLAQLNTGGTTIGDTIATGMGVAADAVQLFNIAVAGGQATLVAMGHAGAAAFIGIGEAFDSFVGAFGNFPKAVDDAGRAVVASLKASADAADAKVFALAKAPWAHVEMARRAAEAKAAAGAKLPGGAGPPRPALAGAALEDSPSVKEEKARIKAEKKLADESKKIFDETRTPMEKYQIELGKLKEQFAAGRIDATTFKRAGIKAHEDAFGKEADKKKFAGAEQAGSAEAYSSQLRFAYATPSKDEPMKEVAKTGKDQLVVQTRMANALDKIVARAVGQVAAAAVELFTL